MLYHKFNGNSVKYTVAFGRLQDKHLWLKQIQYLHLYDSKKMGTVICSSLDRLKTYKTQNLAVVF